MDSDEVCEIKGTAPEETQELFCVNYVIYCKG